MYEWNNVYKVRVEEARMLDGPAQCPTLNAVTQVHFFVCMLALESEKKWETFLKNHTFVW